MTQFSHLDALQARLHRENMRLATAREELPYTRGIRTTACQREIDFRLREIASVEREIAGEYKFLGIEPPAPMTIDEIMAELAA